jgi:hypothetical protein
MPRQIPGPCADLDFPGDCPERFYEIGQCLLDVASAAYAPFAAEDVGPECQTALFVTFGSDREPQPDDQGNQITVFLERITPISVKAGCITRWKLPFRLEAVFAGFPIVEFDDGTAVLPSAEEQEHAARWLLAVGQAFATAFADLAARPEQCTATVGTEIVVPEWLPSGPRGGIAGWRTTIAVTL